MTWEEEQPLWASELSKKRERCAARTWGPNVTDSGVASLLPERAVPQARKTSHGAAEGAGPGLLVPGTLSRRGPPPCLLPGGGNRGCTHLSASFPRRPVSALCLPKGKGGAVGSWVPVGLCRGSLRTREKGARGSLTGLPVPLL